MKTLNVGQFVSLNGKKGHVAVVDFAGDPNPLVRFADGTSVAANVATLVELPESTPVAEIFTTEFVAIGPRCWGKGATPSVAVKNAKADAGLKRGVHTFNVFEVTGLRYISSVDGAINYDARGACKKIDEQAVTVR